MPRHLDHLVLPTADLTVARKRLEKLGFTVAPNARHPFGTENACVFLADGTYLEPLAVAQREDCEAAALQGNVFIRHDQAYRFRRGEDGISALVMTTDNAADDHASFVEAGISAGDNLEFSRLFETPDGGRSMAGFELAFAADLRAPDVFFFTCQRKNPPAVDKTALESHANGVTGVRQVVMSEQNPSDFQYLLQEITQQREVNAHSFGIELKTGNADILALNAAGMTGMFGVASGTHSRGLRLRGIVFTAQDMERLQNLFDDAAIETSVVSERLVVPEAPGQGGFFAFEQA